MGNSALLLRKCSRKINCDLKDTVQSACVTVHVAGCTVLLTPVLRRLLQANVRNYYMQFTEGPDADGPPRGMDGPPGDMMHMRGGPMGPRDMPPRMGMGMGPGPMGPPGMGPGGMRPPFMGGPGMGPPRGEHCVSSSSSSSSSI
jgi:hypothetical protein